MPVFSCLAEVAVWDGRLADARATVALAILAGSEEPYWIVELCRTGLAVEAAAAEHARARRGGAEELAARLIDRVRSVTSAPVVVPTPAVRANLLTAEAEWSRVVGPSDPERWARGAEAWRTLGFPWPTAYARWRQAETLLVQGGPRDAAAAALAEARMLADGLGARLLMAEIDSLARRARIDLGLGLTPREREVLALVAEAAPTARSPRRCSSATRPPASTSPTSWRSCANRGEAAAVAHRLRLTG